MRLAMIGTGYVGLVTGTCFAETGNDVVCVDIDREKIDALRRGQLPIYEPGLAELVARNQREGRLEFTTDLAAALDGARVVFIAVGTPSRENGSADITALWRVVDDIRKYASDGKIVVVKSTVPVGSCAQVEARLNQGSLNRHRVASNPEFLKEGCAVDDFMKPDRVVVGARDSEVGELLRELHAPFQRSGQPYLLMSLESSEMTKYMANALLATKISCVNEVANLCERVDADVNSVRRGIGYDQRIGFQFLHPGPGYGGSCFPKDVRAIVALSEATGVSAHLARAVDRVNEEQKRLLFAKLSEELSAGLSQAPIAVWGLAFKPRTDDVRDAPSLVLLDALLDAGAEIRVHDPEAIRNTREIYGDRLTYCERPYDALDDAQALVIVTEWNEYRQPDFREMRRRLARPLIVDGRNLYEPGRVHGLGFTYCSIGRRTLRPEA